MIVFVLLVAAAYAMAGPRVLEQLRQAAAKVTVPHLGGRHVAAAALLAAAAIAWGERRDTPTPAPPGPDAALTLRGLFVGPSAAADAATVSALMDELASEIEWDGMQPDPLIRSGVAVDDLRRRAREMRCRGVSLGERHPQAREAIKNYLDATAGTAGGPLTGKSRSAWVAAYREVARAAADASR